MTRSLPDSCCRPTLDLTRKAAEEALGVFGKAGRRRRLDARRPARVALERPANRHQGRLLRAAAGPGRSHWPARDPSKVDRALKVLASADRLRPEPFARIPPEQSQVPCTQR